MADSSQKTPHTLEWWLALYATSSAWLLLLRRQKKMIQRILKTALQIWAGYETISQLEIGEETSLLPGSFKEGKKRFIFTISVKREE